ncbi:MAG: hypothetical protein MOB07_23265 [Acidobacteria bacterium]|nr:hypothetical protein [Acidobacteriota bacterium]
MRIILLTLFILICAVAASAQVRGSIGAQYAYGDYGERVPNPTSNTSQSVGGYAEGVAEFKLKDTSLSPRLLGAFNRVYPKGGLEYNQFEIRPELEVKQRLGEYVSVLATGGFSYLESQGDGVTRPLVSAGLQYIHLRVTAGRFFPAGESNLRSWLIRGDFDRPISNHLGLAVSFEYEKATSELPYNQQHPGYSGYVLRTRIGVLIR